MNQVRYIISDASKKIDVEPHVLRYWEEELGVKVPRNEMGHRYYREEDIELFKNIKFLKEQGFQLRAIKMVLSDVKRIGQLDKKKMALLKDELNAQVLSMDQTASEHVEENKDSIKGQAYEAQKEVLFREVCATKPEPVTNQGDPKIAQFKVIMNNIIMEALRENLI